MRICFVSREVAPFVGGGIATYIVEMARALHAAGHEVHILTYPYGDLQERGQRAMPGVQFHATDPAHGPAALPGAFFAEATQYAMAVYTRFKELSATHNFDYAEFPDYRGEGYFVLRAKKLLGLFGATILGVRLHQPLYVLREVDREATLSVEHAHIEHMERYSVVAADLVVSASRAVLDRVRRDLGAEMPDDGRRPNELLRLPLDVSALVRNAAGTAHRAPAEGLPGATPTVLYFGRLQVCKGVQTLTQAAQIVLASGIKARFRFIGGDTLTGPFGRSMRAYLDTRIEERWRDSFAFEPAIPREELAEAVRAAAVCCFPSIWESYSYACVEALAYGAVVVAGDGGSLRELVEHEQSGLVFPAGDADALAVALTRALTDQALRRRLAANAPARASALSEASAIARRLVELVESLRDRQAAAARPSSVRIAASDVSVIIPFFNLGEYLPETLQSLEAQTFRGFELIIVDDGSTEPRSIALLEELRGKGYHVIRKPNGGLGSARNAGFRAARGRWCLPFDADDLAHPALLETLVGAAERDPELAAVSPMFMSFDESPDRPKSGYVPLSADPDLLLFHNIAGSGGGSLLRRDAVLAVGGYDEWLTSFEDWDMWCRLVEGGYRCSVVPEFLFYYRLRPGSLIRSEAIPRQHALKAYLIARHPHLARRPDRTLRLQLAETCRMEALWQEAQAMLEHKTASAAEAPASEMVQLGLMPATVQLEVQRALRENLRYRIADRINDALKRCGIQRVIKRMATALTGRRRRDPS